MSIIMTAGNKKTDWSPKANEEIVKVASTDAKPVVVVEDDPLFAAAKKVVAGFEAIEVEAPVDGAIDVSPVAPCAPCIEEKKDVSETTPAPETKVEEAVEKVEEAVAELKDAVVGGEGDEFVEIEIEEDGEKKGNEDIVVESKPELEACADGAKKEECKEKKEEPKEEPKMEAAAATEDEFCKYAKLSPVNKKKLVNYWVNMLGFPKDFVGLMTKDYEK